MLDTVIADGQAVTPQGAGAWEIGIRGEQIVTVGPVIPLEIMEYGR